jgi:DNA-binding transcriptional MerR regulator
LDKAPDAFRTISEVADDLDIPQHVLRFWETRFTQIKPMKRSGGRRYYRPDDVDLLRGIRRLLYGEGYTIRGVQRILKEHGVKSVQALIDSAAAPSFRGTDDAQAAPVPTDDDHEELEAVEVVEEDTEVEEEADEVETAPPSRRAPQFAQQPRPSSSSETAAAASEAASRMAARKLDVAKLETVLQDLVACRQALDVAMKDG